MKRFFLFLIITETFLSSFAQGCEGCKMASINGFKEIPTIRAGFAFSWSVLFLLFVVFLLLGVLAWAIRIACKHAEEARQISSTVS